MALRILGRNLITEDVGRLEETAQISLYFFDRKMLNNFSLKTQATNYLKQIFWAVYNRELYFTFRIFPNRRGCAENHDFTVMIARKEDLITS